MLKLFLEKSFIYSKYQGRTMPFQKWSEDTVASLRPSLVDAYGYDSIEKTFTNGITDLLKSHLYT